MQTLAQGSNDPNLRVFNVILILLLPRGRIVSISHSGQIHSATETGRPQLLSAPSAVFGLEQVFLDRCCNKPVFSLASSAIATDPLREISARLNSSPVHCRNGFTISTTLRVPVDCGQLTSLHEQFLERGREVSHDLLLMSRRNSS